jgi:5-carboxymethyl-2-hydroxymuconate isomerase
VGDGRPENGFVHITLRIRPGREPEIKRRLGETLFNAACEFLRPVFDGSPLGLTLEVQDIDVDFRFLKNNMTDFWAAADAPAAGNTG